MSETVILLCVCFLPVPSVKWIFSFIYRCKTYFSLTFCENILHKRKIEIFLKSLNSVTKFFLLAFYFLSFASAKEMLREREERQHHSSVFSFLCAKGDVVLVSHGEIWKLALVGLRMFSLVVFWRVLSLLSLAHLPPEPVLEIPELRHWAPTVSQVGFRPADAPWQPPRPAPLGWLENSKQKGALHKSLEDLGQILTQGNFEETQSSFFLPVTGSPKWWKHVSLFLSHRAPCFPLYVCSPCSPGSSSRPLCWAPPDPKHKCWAQALTLNLRLSSLGRTLMLVFVSFINRKVLILYKLGIFFLRI